MSILDTHQCYGDIDNLLMDRCDDLSHYLELKLEEDSYKAIKKKIRSALRSALYELDMKGLRLATHEDDNNDNCFYDEFDRRVCPSTIAEPPRFTETEMNIRMIEFLQSNR